MLSQRALVSITNGVKKRRMELRFGSGFGRFGLVA